LIGYKNKIGNIYPNIPNKDIKVVPTVTPKLPTRPLYGKSVAISK